MNKPQTIDKILQKVYARGVYNYGEGIDSLDTMTVAQGKQALEHLNKMAMLEGVIEGLSRLDMYINELHLLSVDRWILDDHERHLELLQAELKILEDTDE